MTVTHTRSIILATVLGIVPASVGDLPLEQTAEDLEIQAIRQGTWEMTRPQSDQWNPRRFEVRTTTVLRNPDGSPVGDTLHGRVTMTPDSEGMTFAIERWGGNGAYARGVFDGTTLTWFVPSSRDFERSNPVDTASTEDWTWLRCPELVGRLGPATSHLFEVLYFDGFADFEANEGPMPVDLGPVQGIAFAGRPADWRQPAPELDAVHVALSDDPLGFPLAIATRLPDGRMLEFEYHDWAIETEDRTIGSFDETDTPRFVSNPSADWTEVMAIRIPGVESPDVDVEARFAGRTAAPTIVDTNRATSFDAFDGDGPVAVLFHQGDDSVSMGRLIAATTGFELAIHGVQVGGDPRSGTHWISADSLDRVWGFDRLPALVIVDGDRTVLEARSPWYGPKGRPATDIPVATAAEE